MLNKVPSIKYILYTNILLFLISMISNDLFNKDLLNCLVLYPFDNINFAPYQFISNTFLHASLSHIFFNMIALYSFGPDVEYTLGSRKFLLYYIIIGGISSLIQLLITPYPLIGASGAVFGIIIYSTMLNPNSELSLLFLPIHFKLKTFTIFLVLYELYSAFFEIDNIGHWAHLGGALCAFIIYYIDKFYNIEI